MITTEKRFGSYVLKKINYEDLLQSSAVKPIIIDGNTDNAGTEIDSNPTSLNGSGVTINNVLPLGSMHCAIPSEWISLKLLLIESYNHDTSIFTFQLPSNCKYLNLPVGGFLLVLGPHCDHDGNDAIRPYTSISDDYIDNRCKDTGSFQIMCKRYDQWGVKESLQTNFLFTRTNHSYRPSGALSNYIHRLKVEGLLQFKFTSLCHGKLVHDDSLLHIREMMMIAVGVGIAPMVQILRTILRVSDHRNMLMDGEDTIGQGIDEIVDVDNGTGDSRSMSTSDDIKRHLHAKEYIHYHNVERVVLLYGVRTVEDILLKEQLDAWQAHHPHLLKVVYCVGSRWTNIHWGAKNHREYTPPPPPTGFDQLNNAELGWVNEDKIRKHGLPPSGHMKAIVCGLPGVYDKLCGSRDLPEVAPNSVLHKLGYTSTMVVKL